MDRAGWATLTDSVEASARAGGRRRYNRLRQDLAAIRRIEVLRLARGYENGWLRRGFQAAAARELGVSAATICRDVRVILKKSCERDICPKCGSRRLPPGCRL